MLENLRCNCSICKVERHLFKSLAEQPASVQFSTLALSSPPLARSSNVSELLTDLRTRRNGDSGASLAGELVSALIHAGTAIHAFELIQSVPVLAFTPTIHRTYREVRAWFRDLVPNEYETPELELRHVDLERATRDYRPRAMAGKASAGFSLYGRSEGESLFRRVLDEREITARILTL
jgi:hypothetical protein